MPEIIAAEPNRLQVFLEANENATDAQRQGAEAAFGAGIDEEDGGYTVDGDTARFDVCGVLRKTESPLARFLGFNMTSYAGIIRKCREIEALDDVKTVRVTYDTPGGYVDGLDEAWQAMASLAKSKTVVAEVRGMLCSGGYWLASASSRIESSAPSNMIGSIGVVVVYTSWKEYDKKLGVKEIVIRSKNAPNKVPDADSKEGRGIIQAQIDALERIFYQRISEGRGISIETIAEKFGRGDVFVSQDPASDKPDAIKNGMIDGLVAPHGVQHIDSNPNPKAKGSTAMLNEEQIKSAVEVIGGQYPQALKNLAEKVLCGESESASLSAAKACWDSRENEAGQNETAAQEAAAAAESAFQIELAEARRNRGLPVVEPAGAPAGAVTGMIETEADLDAAAKRLRAKREKE